MTVLLEITVWLVGLCVGSFLNVVIYRVPHGLSISKPRWSFCPRCETTLCWYDNLPVLAWLSLHARCRYCRAPISFQYPLVEAVTGLAFVLTFHLLWVDHARAGLGVTSLPADGPLILAWLVLIGALVACAGMDFVSYMVDTRITDFALYVGVVLFALWPRPDFTTPTASGPLGAACLAAGVVSVLMLWLTVWWRQDHLLPLPEDEQHDEPEIEHDELFDPQRHFGATAVAIVGFCFLALALIVAGAAPDSLPSAARDAVAPSAFFVLFLAMVLAGGHHREVDAELHEAIQEEAGESHAVVLGELVWLLPSLMAGVAAYLLVQGAPAIADGWAALVGWRVGGFAPIAGIAFAAHGAVVAAAAGWIVRIVFTLAFGREAFGVGDIFMLAAAGGAVGADIALLGFLLAIPISVGGWLCGLLLKRTSLIAFGPPLALGFLAALWLNRPAAARFEHYQADVLHIYQSQPRMLLLGMGLLLVASVFAVVFAKLLRRLIESHEDEPAAFESETVEPESASTDPAALNDD